MNEVDSNTALAMLDWQIELGADEAIRDTPVNRYDVPAKPAPHKANAQKAERAASADPVAEARAAAA
ncbi:MAG: uracil-DNA glycosylase, partial [Pseudomonadota bacterium]